jgi:hypothetical protein
MITDSTEARELDDVRSWHLVDITITLNRARFGKADADTANSSRHVPL